MGKTKLVIKQPVKIVQKIVKGLVLAAALVIILGFIIAFTVKVDLGLVIATAGLVSFAFIFASFMTFPGITGFSIKIRDDKMILTQGISKYAQRTHIAFANITKMYRLPHSTVESKKKYWTEGDISFWGVAGGSEIQVIHYIEPLFGGEEKRILQLWIPEIEQLEALLYEKAPHVKKTDNNTQYENILANKERITQQSGLAIAGDIYAVIIIILGAIYAKLIGDSGFNLDSIQMLAFVVIVVTVFYYEFVIKPKTMKVLIYPDRITVVQGLWGNKIIPYTARMQLSKGVFEKDVTDNHKRIGLKRAKEVLIIKRPDAEHTDEQEIRLACVDASSIKSSIEVAYKMNPINF